MGLAVCDHAACLLSLDNRGSAIVEVDYLRPAAAPSHGDISLRVAGANGVLEVRPGSCQMTTHTHGAEEIAPPAMPRPFHQELLEVAMGKPSDRFGTSHSLPLAEFMLTIRDVADKIVPP